MENKSDDIYKKTAQELFFYAYLFFTSFLAISSKVPLF
jgi:hypothetical protein